MLYFIIPFAIIILLSLVGQSAQNSPFTGEQLTRWASFGFFLVIGIYAYMKLGEILGTIVASICATFCLLALWAIVYDGIDPSDWK